MNQQFCLACENPKLREGFIKLVVDKLPLTPYVKKVIYSEKKNGSTVMSTKIPFLYPLIKMRPTIIVVYPSSFDLNFHPQVEDFISTLYYHEGHHAKEIYLGIHKRIPATCIEEELEETCRIEIRAIKNQIENFSGNSERFMKRVRDNLSSLERWNLMDKVRELDWLQN